MEMTKDELCDFLQQMESPPAVLLTAVRRATASNEVFSQNKVGCRRRLRPTCFGLRCWAYKPNRCPLFSGLSPARIMGQAHYFCSATY